MSEVNIPVKPAEIILKPRDLCIKTLPDGTEVANINPRLGFDEDFIAEMKVMGVKEWKSKAQKEIEEADDYCG